MGDRSERRIPPQVLHAAAMLLAPYVRGGITDGELSRGIDSQVASRLRPAKALGQGAGAAVQNKQLTARQVAERCGVSLRTVWKWVSSGRLRVHRISSRLVRISEADLAAFLAGTATPRGGGEAQ